MKVRYERALVGLKSLAKRIGADWWTISMSLDPSGVRFSAYVSMQQDNKKQIGYGATPFKAYQELKRNHEIKE